MHTDTLKALLESIRLGETSVDSAMERMRTLPFESVGFAHIDHHRSIRCGFPEVIYCEGKTPEQVAGVFQRMAAAGADVLATRANQSHVDAVRAVLPSASHHTIARCITLKQSTGKLSEGCIALLAAGTSDLPMIEEARVTCDLLGQRTSSLTDVGVAGLHRLLAHLDMLRAARVVVVAAGMDGALPAVVKGLISAPVIALPTSVGYGASFGGIAPLLTMLNACAPGVAVVNIDAGFSAGYLAALINQTGDRTKE